MKPTPARSTISFRRLLLLGRYNHAYSLTIRQSHSDANSSRPGSASAKLFADAAREGAEEPTSSGNATTRSTRVSALEQQHENWTGDESIQDAVLRMLIDKYKPLRTGSVQSAEEKLKRVPPSMSSSVLLADETDISSTTFDPVGCSPMSTQSSVQPASVSWASEPLLPSTSGHEPWHTTFKAPSHSISSIKLGQMPPPIITSKIASAPLDDRARRLEKEKKRKAQHAGRLTQAKESTLDYKMGMRNVVGPRGMSRPNPVSVKGWTNLIEDKIEKARKAGLFKEVKGRGQPLARSMDEHNPFIAREEFLMNRIVQRNGASPPWVEVQGELELAVQTFRDILRQSWIRRTIRILVLDQIHPSFLSKLSLEDIITHRDSEWVQKEKSYHDTAIAELNNLVRKYNALAPYAVRKIYYIREVELERLYLDCAEDILKGIRERREVGELGAAGGSLGQDGGGARGGGSRMSGCVEPAKFSSADDSGFFRRVQAAFRRLFGVG